MSNGTESKMLGIETRAITLRSGPLRPGDLTFEAEGWVLGDFAVHRNVDAEPVWQISILPLGMCLAIDWCAFDDFDDAVAAMKDIAALRNDWHLIRQADLTKPLEAQLKVIARRHGAPERWVVGAGGFSDRNKFGHAVARRPNGYGAALD
jgi:hypothetical protein